MHPANVIIDEQNQARGFKRTIEERVSGHSIGWKMNNALEKVAKHTKELDKLLHRPIDINQNF